MANAIKILSYNANCFRDDTNLISDLAVEYGVHVICIQESRAPAPLPKLNIPGFKQFRLPRKKDESLGLITYVRQDLK